MKRLLHTFDHMLHFTCPTGLLESILIIVMLKINIHTLKMGSSYEMKTKDRNKENKATMNKLAFCRFTCN